MTRERRLTNEQLRAIRTAGFVPWSRVSTKCCAFAGMFSFVLLNIERLLKSFRGIGDLHESSFLAETLFFFVFGSSAVFLATGFIVSIVQTRAAPSLNILRVTVTQSSKPSVILEIFGFFIGVGVGVSLLYWMLKVIPMQLILEPLSTLSKLSFIQFSALLSEVVGKIASPLILGLVATGFIAAISSRRRFIRLHSNRQRE